MWILCLPFLQLRGNPVKRQESLLPQHPNIPPHPHADSPLLLPHQGTSLLPHRYLPFPLRQNHHHLPLQDLLLSLHHYPFLPRPYNLFFPHPDGPLLPREINHLHPPLSDNQHQPHHQDGLQHPHPPTPHPPRRPPSTHLPPDIYSRSAPRHAPPWPG